MIWNISNWINPSPYSHHSLLYNKQNGKHTTNNYLSVLNSMELGNPVIHLSVLWHLLSLRGLKYLYATTHTPGINYSHSNNNPYTESNFSLREQKTIKFTKTFISQKISLQNTDTINIIPLKKAQLSIK